MEQNEVWRRCGPCKKAINFNQPYYLCSVSTCRKNAFCSQSCWEAHLGYFRHKEAWPENAVSPPREENAKEEKRDKIERIVKKEREKTMEPSNEDSKEVLIVASKLKGYIKHKSQLSTSGSVIERLSDIVRELTDRAIEKAQKDGRKTVMDRDF